MRRRIPGKVAWGGFLLALVVWGLVPVKGTPPPSSRAPADPRASGLPLLFDGNNAYHSIASQLQFGYRIPGTQASKDCADYFLANLTSLCQVNSHQVVLHGVECQNIYGVLNPHVTTDIVILGAHYDSRAITEKDAPTSTPCEGANDGGSGCGVLLELARALHQIRAVLNVQVWFVFFDAEDQGSGGMSGWDWAEGSREFALNLESLLGDVPVSTVKLMLLLDMVGGPGVRFCNDNWSNRTVQNLFFQLGRSMGYTDAFPTNPRYFGSLVDDHKWFVSIHGIPAVDFIIDFTDTSGSWPYHHTTGDTLAHISADSLSLTGRTVEKFFHEYYVSAEDGGGGKQAFWEYAGGFFLDEGGAMIISFLIGVCFILGMHFAYKAASRKPQHTN